MSNKESDRKRYVPEGSEFIHNNTYTFHDMKNPARRDRSRIIDDPIILKDKKQEKEDMKLSKEDQYIDLAKKIARKKLAGEIKHIRDTSDPNAGRELIDGFKFKDKGLKAIAETYKSLASAFYHMIKSSNSFNSMRSSEISPDGKMGGKGYIQEIKTIRQEMANCINIISGLIDTFYDEVNSPNWKKTVYEDHPLLKDILEESDKIIDVAEQGEENKKIDKVTAPENDTNPPSGIISPANQ